MKLFLIKRRDYGGYDTYDSTVVASLDETDAANIHPSGNDEYFQFSYSWIKPEEVIVEYIGEAREDISRGVIVASFNAG